MAGVKLYDYQIDAIKRMNTGSILCGGVGSGKLLTALGYYYVINGGDIYSDSYKCMLDDPPLDLYVITTARKRDTMEWDRELLPFLLSTNPDCNHYKNKVVIDSWNNIGKYADVKNAFFIFDEQRVVGNGAWVKSFIKITKSNQWILLSATPGDTWMDYVPVFIANGFFKNRSEFYRDHVIFSPWAKYPKVQRYINVERLTRLRSKILVDMDFNRKTRSHHINMECEYDRKTYMSVVKNRWNVFENEPLQNAVELCYILRKVVNTDDTRIDAVERVLRQRNKIIVFYNFNYEREMLIQYADGAHIPWSEWSGHAHEDIPDTGSWMYLVQYTAGCEGWNCIKTDTILFFSQNYSYKVMEQACGRIDRLNTPFEDLYFYHLVSKSPIDRAIGLALSKKKKFNERAFVKW